MTAVNDALYLEATAAGAAGDSISFSLQNTAYASAQFAAPSFPSVASSGTLTAGAAQGADSGTVVYNYQTQFEGANNLISDIDQVMGTWSYQYDNLNRLTGATANQAGNLDTHYCWAYDAFGKRTLQAGSSAAFTAGSPACTPSGTSSYNGTWAHYSTANNNRLANTNQAMAGVGYDAAGEVTNDGVNQYLYDGDGRVCAVSSSQITGGVILTGYVYNAAGQRVSKGTITNWSCDPAISGFTAMNDYVLGPGGEQVTEMAANASKAMVWQHTNVYAAGALFATYDDNGLHFHLNDSQGTRRVQTDYAGVMEQTCSSLPFGDTLNCSNSIQFPTEHHFTGKERDTESGLDYFESRYYGSSIGRFMSPDWALIPAPVPFATLDNPQSLNLYSYVGNNPLSHADADGHCCESDFNSFSDHPGHFTGGSVPMDATFARALGTTTMVGLGAGGAIAAAPEVLSLAAAADTTAKGLAVGVAALNVTGMGVNAVTNAVGSAMGMNVSDATNAVTVATNPIATVGAAVTGSAEKGANMADLATVGQAATGMMQGRAPANSADVVNSVGGAVDAVKGAVQSGISSLRPATMSIQSPAAPGPPSCSVAGACSK